MWWKGDCQRDTSSWTEDGLATTNSGNSLIVLLLTLSASNQPWSLSSGGLASWFYSFTRLAVPCPTSFCLLLALFWVCSAAETQLWWWSTGPGRSGGYPCRWHRPLWEMWFIEAPSFSRGAVGGRQTPVCLENILRNLGKWFLGLSVGFFHLKVQFNT